MSPQEISHIMQKQNPFSLLAKCIDDSLPPFHVEEWVEAGEVYEVMGMGEESMHNNVAIAVAKRGVHIKPTATIDVFKADRFKIFQICNN